MEQKQVQNKHYKMDCPTTLDQLNQIQISGEHFTIPVSNRLLSTDMWHCVGQFIDAFDFLSLMTCSKRSREAVLLPSLIRLLLKRNSHRTVDHGRCVLAVVFLSRQRRSVLMELIQFLQQPTTDFICQHRFFMFSRLARLSEAFPNEPAIYYMTTNHWKMPATLAAAWLNDIDALYGLADQRRFQPNAKMAWPGQCYMTPLSRCSDPTCLAFLVNHGAYTKDLDLRRDGDPEPWYLIHELSRQCSPSALRTILACGAREEINWLGDHGSCLHQACVVGPVRFHVLSKYCSPKMRIRQQVACQWKQTIELLLENGANPSNYGSMNMTHSHLYYPSTHALVRAWNVLAKEIGSTDLLNGLEQMLKTLKKTDDHFIRDQKLLLRVVKTFRDRVGDDVDKVSLLIQGNLGSSFVNPPL